MLDADRPLQLEKHLRLRKQLSTVQKSSIGEIWKNAEYGEKISSVQKFIRARFGPGKLSSSEFIQFELAKANIPYREIEMYAGKRAQQAFNKVYNDWSWYAVTKNKLVFETLMRGAALPCPETIAVFDRKGRGAGSPILKTTDELGEFLTSKKNHPIFCKPTTGLLSIGSFRIDGKVGKRLLVNGSHEYPLDEVQSYISGISKKGYLFQKVLEPHRRFSEIGCSVIASVRMIVLNFEERAELHSAVLKLPASGEVADNFWREGSIIATINKENGTVQRAVIKTPERTELIAGGPKGGNKVLEFTLPEFEVAKATVLKASRFLPGIRVQSWDVAITTKGPVLLEVNFGGDLNLYQLANGKGIMDKTYCTILREAGYSGRLPN